MKPPQTLELLWKSRDLVFTGLKHVNASVCAVSRRQNQRGGHSGDPPQSPTLPGRRPLLSSLKTFFTKQKPSVQSVSQRRLCAQVELVRREYVANGGWETFLSYEDPEQDILIGLLRLRRCSPQSFRPELKGGTSIVRELHVYGSVVPVSGRDPSKFQHQVLTHT